MNKTKKNHNWKEVVAAVSTFIMILVLIIGDRYAKHHKMYIRENVLTETIDEEEIAKKIMQMCYIYQPNKEQLYENMMTNICVKLQKYSQELGDNVEDGIITLSEKEMIVLRKFLQKESPEYYETIFKWAGGLYSWNTDEILGYQSDKGYNIMGLGIWNYKEYKFVLHCNRKLVYLDFNTRKTIVITNSVDYPDTNYSQYENVLWGNEPGEEIDQLCNLQINNDCCYAYCETETGIRVEKWVFGEKLHTWYGEKLNTKGIWLEGPPSVVESYAIQDIHLFIAKGNLLYFHESENEIKVIAQGLDGLDAVIVNSLKNTLYYACSNEVHMVCIETLEDIVIAKNFGTNLQKANYFGSYATYYDENKIPQIVEGYFDENNRAVISRCKMIEYIEDNTRKLMETLGS